MKIGAIGTSFIMDTILENMASTKGMSCQSIFSRSYDKGKALADKFHISKVYFHILPPRDERDRSPR